jgi:hypothetical protein
MMLFLRPGKVDRLALDEGKFAVDDGRTDGSGNRSEHGEASSLHEILLSASARTV